MFFCFPTSGRCTGKSLSSFTLTLAFCYLPFRSQKGFFFIARYEWMQMNKIKLCSIFSKSRFFWWNLPYQALLELSWKLKSSKLIANDHDANRFQGNPSFGVPAPAFPHLFALTPSGLTMQSLHPVSICSQPNTRHLIQLNPFNSSRLATDKGKLTATPLTQHLKQRWRRKYAYMRLQRVCYEAVWTLFCFVSTWSK